MARRHVLTALALAAPLLLAAAAAPSLAAWSSVRLPEHVASLSALTAGNQYLFAAMVDSSDTNLGVFRTPLEAPGTWEPLGSAGHFIRKIIVAGDDDSQILIPGTGDMAVIGSSDGGRTWIPRDSGIPDDRWILNLGWNGAWPGRMYASACRRGGQDYGFWIYSSSDFGTTWSQYTFSEHGVTQGLRYFAVPHGDPAVAYVVEATGYFETAMWKTDDAGTSWRGIYRTISDPFMFDLDVSFTAPYTLIYPCGYDTVWWWYDDVYQGEMCSPLPWGVILGADIPIWKPTCVFAAGLEASDVRTVVYSEYPGCNWIPIRDGLPDEPFQGSLGYSDRRAFQFESGPNALFFSFWNELYARDMTDVAAAPEARRQERAYLISPRPNPASGDGPITIGITGGTKGRPARLEILDATGRLVRRLAPGGPSSSVVWDGRTDAGVSAPAGQYYIRLCGANGPASRITLVR